MSQSCVKPTVVAGSFKAKRYKLLLLTSILQQVQNLEPMSVFVQLDRLFESRVTEQVIKYSAGYSFMLR